MSLKITMFRNVGASAFCKLLGSVCILVTVPVLLALLGVQHYGVWLVISAVPSWLSIADIGFGAVAANEMSIRSARGDWLAAQAIFQSAWAAILCLSGIAVAVVLPLAYFGDWRAWLSISDISREELSWCLALLGISSIIALQGQVASGLFRAVGKSDIAILIGGVKPVTDMICIIVALLISHTVMSASIGLLCSQISLLFFGLVYGLRACPKIRPGFSGCNLTDIRFCMRKGLAFCMFPFGSAMVIQGATLVVNHVLGPVGVVAFNTCRTMMRSAQQVTNLIGYSAWPEFSRLVGAGDLGRARKLHHLTLLVNMVFAIFISMTLIIAGPWIYAIWTGRQLHVDRWLIAAFSVGIISNAIWFASSMIVGASNRHERLAIFYLAGALLTLPVCYFGAQYFGLYGAALASAVCDILVAPVAIFQALRITGETLGSFYMGLLATARESTDGSHGMLLSQWRKLAQR